MRSLLAALLFTCTVAGASAQGRVDDNGRALFLICASRGFDEGCTSAYSYSIKLFAAQDSYRLDPRKASEEAGLILGDHFDEKTYMKIMADRIEKEIDGYALGNTPFGKTVNIIAGAAFGTLIDR